MYDQSIYMYIDNKIAHVHVQSDCHITVYKAISRNVVGKRHQAYKTRGWLYKAWIAYPADKS